MDEDWQVGKSCTERNRYMLENELGTDVVFLVSQISSEEECDTREDEPAAKKQCRQTRNSTKDVKVDDIHPATASNSVRIQAHKYMLGSRSPVFFAMFFGDLAEKGEVRVTDVDPHIFREMLNFIYYDEAAVTLETMQQFLYVARKYFIAGLVQYCEKHLQKLLDFDSVLELLDYSLEMEEPNMVSHCMEFIKLHTKGTLYGKDRHPSYKAMAEILKLNRIHLNEIELFEYLFQWGEMEVVKQSLDQTSDNIRQVLGDLRFGIRYPVLTLAEMADIVGKSNILEPKEIWPIVQYMCSVEKDNVPYNLLCEKRCISELCFDTDVPHLQNRLEKVAFEQAEIAISIQTHKSILLTYLTLAIEKRAGAPKMKYQFSDVNLDEENLDHRIVTAQPKESQPAAFNKGKHLSLIFKNGIHLEKGSVSTLNFKLKASTEEEEQAGTSKADRERIMFTRLLHYNTVDADYRKKTKYFSCNTVHMFFDDINIAYTSFPVAFFGYFVCGK